MTLDTSSKPDVITFFDPTSCTFSYVVIDPDSGCCAAVDPVLDYVPSSGRTSHAGADRLIDFVRSKGLRLQWILETHAHADHLTAAVHLKQKLGGKHAIGENITVVQRTFGKLFNAEAEFATDGSQFDRLFSDDEQFSIGKLSARAIHTPGHTPACVTYLIGDAAFVGDAIFMPDLGTGRCDFPGGDARTLYRSIRKILALPESTRLFLCHDYQAPGRDEFRHETTVAEERSHNIHVHDGITEDDFVALRTAKDASLSVPNLILPSLQVNMRAGVFPPAEANGTRYLKIPIDVL